MKDKSNGFTVSPSRKRTKGGLQPGGSMQLAWHASAARESEGCVRNRLQLSERLCRRNLRDSQHCAGTGQNSEHSYAPATG